MSGRGSQVFNLMRYYSIASLVCIVLAAAILGMLYRHLSLNPLTNMDEGRNAALTNAFDNALRPHFSLLLRPGPADPAVASLRREVVALMKETSAVRVRIYNMNGLTLFFDDRFSVISSGS